VKNFTYDEQMDLCSKISEMDAQSQEIIYVIIRFYDIYIEKNHNENLPYRPKLNKNGIKFELNNLPFQLQYMLLQFVKMHFEKCREDEERHKKLFSL